MSNAFSRQLKIAFDADLTVARKTHQKLVADSKAHKGIQIRRALDFRIQVERHVKKLVGAKTPKIQIEAYLDEARKIFKTFLGEK